MPTIKLKHVSSLFSAFKSGKTSLLSAEDKALAATASSGSPTDAAGVLLRKNRQRKESSRLQDPKARGEFNFKSSNTTLHSAKSSKGVADILPSILLGGVSVDEEETSHDFQKFEGDRSNVLLECSWYSSKSKYGNAVRRKDVMRNRKEKWVFKSTQNIRIDQVIVSVAARIGTDTTVDVFGKLGRETGVKEFNALIKVCLEEARSAENEKDLLKQILRGLQLLEAMKEQGFQLEEETYGPFLNFLMDMEMIEEFEILGKVIYTENPKSLPRLAYYEMLLWIRLNKEEKIKELCHNVLYSDDEDARIITENYFLALCEHNRKELLLLVKAIDITQISSPKDISTIFRSLGRLLLDTFLIKYISVLKDFGSEDLSNFVCDYVIAMPDVAAEDIVVEFDKLQQALEVTPCSASYGMLIKHLCDSLKVHVALDVVDHIFDAGLNLSAETFNSLLEACHRSCNYNLVHRIYSIFFRSNLKPNNDVFRSMITLCVRMKDFDGAYNMIEDLGKYNVEPTAIVYNAIMAGYFKERNMLGALKVLKSMKKAGVCPDSQTYSYLIGTCNREEDIVKYCEEMKESGVQITKPVWASIVNAYAACGLFEKAKQVVYKTIGPGKNSNEIKGALISAFAHHGQIADALNLYEEIRGNDYRLDPHVIISLIEHIQSDGELVRLLHLLEEIKEPEYWVDGCNRVILYCIRYKHLSSIVDLLKQLKDKLSDDEIATEVLFDQVFSAIADAERPDVLFGLNLLQAIKKELGVFPSRRCLGFLLSACASIQDLPSSLLVWKEYKAAGFPYNALTLLSMYKVLLACGDRKSAGEMLKSIPKEDSEVCSVIKAYQNTYETKKSKTKTAKKKGKN